MDQIARAGKPVALPFFCGPGVGHDCCAAGVPGGCWSLLPVAGHNVAVAEAREVGYWSCSHGGPLDVAAVGELLRSARQSVRGSGVGHACVH
mmetsp:Transcript_57931/g.126983  ORF Transcript_57931/g.126983 Transcript_57931/m.126983 type:complete len:92 (+) Transcript_57931:296-571(+)